MARLLLGTLSMVPNVFSTASAGDFWDSHATTGVAFVGEEQNICVLCVTQVILLCEPGSHIT